MQIWDLKGGSSELVRGNPCLSSKRTFYFSFIQNAKEMFPCKKSNPWTEALHGPWAKELESNTELDNMADRPKTLGLSLGVGVPIPCEYNSSCQMTCMESRAYLVVENK
ncbi:hypothetical protein OIU85_021868 [Salix viminalis]|uniref:Uncharacterized protein n=1 Tax=Salix viminalis TaxID=40686 RepID=A0A9Q0UJH1_SALVM|nr:hypothetical protein OIU85_021868 [Salix viminalis]